MALICERLHVLPDEGGVFAQNGNAIRRLLIVFDQLDTFRQEEMDKIGSNS